MRTLIADDSEQIRRLVAEALSQIPGIELIGQTQDAPETIRAIRELRPDVVILDIRMPVAAASRCSRRSSTWSTDRW